MWGAVVLSSEPIEKDGTVESSTVRSSELLKRAGSIGNFTVPDSELIEEIGIRRRAGTARRRTTECIFMKKDGERAVLFSFLRCMPYFSLHFRA